MEKISGDSGLSCVKKNSWSNRENSLFYSTVFMREFLRYAHTSGMINCPDLELLQNYIYRADSILEVGAGYGRVINYILNRGYRGKLTALERSKKYCHILKKFYGDYIRLLEADIQSVEFAEKHDLILWLWGGILDFPAYEQLSALAQIRKGLRKHGYLVIDTLPLNNENSADPSDTPLDHPLVVHNNLVLHGYFTQCKEIKSYCEQLNLTYVTKLTYTTVNQLKHLHILTC